jgi:hypothetical protein
MKLLSPLLIHYGHNYSDRNHDDIHNVSAKENEWNTRAS